MPENTAILPYPSQLPQDYYNKNLPGAPAAAVPAPITPPTIPEPIDPNLAVSNGGIYYGPEPPIDPSNGWLWSPGDGTIYMFMDPGVWSQIGTNW